MTGTVSCYNRRQPERPARYHRSITGAPMADSDPLLAWRSEFPILQETTYMVSNSLGAMPRAVYDSLRAYADTWASRGVRAWGEGWWDLNVEIGNRVGAIIGAPDDTVSIHQNISLAMGVLLSCFDFSGPRNRVVIEAGIFPSVYYVLRGMLPSHVDLYTVPSGDDGLTIDTGRIVDAIDERTLLVPISHVLFRSAYILDVKAIIEKAHAVGAIVIVDGYHAGGIVPFDVSALNADFYLGGVLKWMCGGPGGVFLYAREDYLRTLQPGLTGWQAHQRPFSFEVDEMDYRDGAFRMLNGTPAIPNLHAIQPGIDIIAKVGVENIRAKSQRQTEMIIRRADAAGYQVNTPRDPAVRGGSVVVNPPHAYEVSRELIEQNFIVDFRQGAGIRISPHFYNSDEEVARTMNAIDGILAGGSWQKHAQGRTFVT
ncbi:MAG: aminotransferase class V-fold PLP-dependent enzyme [Anaerolineae bacterium]|nr:aminotransferase class V-fold PLP-dependent enzyme [Anaerolineae bacterium]